MKKYRHIDDTPAAANAKDDYTDQWRWFETSAEGSYNTKETILLTDLSKSKFFIVISSSINKYWYY